MESVPAGQESNAASLSVRIPVLDDSYQVRLPPCPDWPDLN
jgi:hypothetical protein